MENEIQTKNKSNSIVVIAILAILVGLLVGYIVFDKYITGGIGVEATKNPNI